MTSSRRLWTRIKGTFMRPVSNAAGDRRREAKAALESVTGREPEDGEVDAAQRVVREQHHDIRPRMLRRSK